MATFPGFCAPTPKNNEHVYLQLELPIVRTRRGRHGEVLEGDAGGEGVPARVGLAVLVSDVDIADRHLQVLEDVDQLKQESSFSNCLIELQETKLSSIKLSGHF